MEEELRAEVQAAYQAAEAAQRDRELLTRLAEARSRKADDYLRTLKNEPNMQLAVADPEQEYRAAFQAYGVDVLALPAAEVVARLRQRPEAVVIEVAAALDDWVFERRKQQQPEAAWRSLLELAMQLDRDKVRGQLRQALASGNLTALQILAKSELSVLPVASVSLLGVALRDAGDVAGSIQWLRAGQIRFPGDVWINYELAESLNLAKPPRWEEALRYYTAARALRPELGYRLALGLDAKGEKAAALLMMQELLRLQPTNPWNHLGLGILFGKEGRVDESIAAYQEALRLKKDFPPAHNNLGNALAKKDDLVGAIQEYQATLRSQKDFPQAHYNLGNALAKKGDLIGAIQSYQAALRHKQDYPLAHHNLGKALSDKGDLDGAIKAYQAALRHQQDYPEAHLGLGLALFERGDLEGAIKAYQAALRLKKDYPEAHHNLGNALLKKGNVDGAITEYQAALRLKKDAPYPHVGLGMALARKGKVEEAIQAYQAALRLKKDDPLAHINLGNALARKGDVEGAIQAFQAALRYKKEFPGAHYNLGNALEAKGDVAGAIAAYQAALRLKKNFADAHYNLGRVLRRQGRFAEASAAFRRAAELDAPSRPESAKQAEQLARCCEALVALEKRLPALRARKERPKDNADRLALADLCLNKQLNVSAAQLYADAFAADTTVADDLTAGYRQVAAFCAALAGCGKGSDADKLDAKERARWRQQALHWLRVDLQLWTKQLEKDTPKIKALVQRTLLRWQQHLDLAGVRDAKALAALPEAEQTAWREFWADVDALLKTAQGKP
jgi:tetratricopeptide (TPR) repeat protein